ncbi:MAG: hypothetical protein KF784_10070 [Fimbriimonadaceae bacterium]|nr:hypothetical protein [Fimbriimonadaceae bacterium]
MLFCCVILRPLCIDTRESEIKQIFARVPLGSDVRALRIVDEYNTASYRPVTEWIRTDDLSQATYKKLRESGVILGTKYGDFRQKELGHYSEDCPPTQGFTGVVFFILDSYADTFVGDGVGIEFTYIDGKLVNKAVVPLPG